MGLLPWFRAVCGGAFRLARGVDWSARNRPQRMQGRRCAVGHPVGVWCDGPIVTTGGTTACRPLILVWAHVTQARHSLGAWSGRAARRLIGRHWQTSLKTASNGPRPCAKQQDHRIRFIRVSGINVSSSVRDVISYCTIMINPTCHGTTDCPQNQRHGAGPSMPHRQTLWHYVKGRPAMRLKSEIWVKAYLRVRSAAGVSAMVVRHGDDDAGAVFIKVATLDGRATLYGPAPSGFEPTGADRRWVAHLAKPTTTEADVDAYLERQADFDPDLWVIEVEDRAGRHFLDDWLMSDKPGG